MKLSLCIATFNEEKFIHYPLDSAYDLVDEVVIVDGGSTDQTIRIAKSYGSKVRVIQTSNPPMFHINKQKALDAARGEWILQLDADEALSEDLRQEIKDLLQKNSKSKTLNPKQITSRNYQNSKSDPPRVLNLELRAPTGVAYWVPRKNYFLGRFLTKGGQYPDYTIRLYKRGAVKFPLKSVHENVEVEGEGRRAVGYLKSPLLHYADPTFGRYLARWRRYNRLDSLKLRKELRTSRYPLHNIFVALGYVFVKPPTTFFSIYIRHKGFMDGWQGLFFAFFSSIRFIPIYLSTLTSLDKIDNL